jgi:hypothetical protein
MSFLSLWNWFEGGSWKSLDIWATESLGCYKQSLIGKSGGSLGDQNANRNADSKDYAHEVLGGSKDSVEILD